MPEEKDLFMLPVINYNDNGHNPTSWKKGQVTCDLLVSLGYDDRCRNYDWKHRKRTCFVQFKSQGLKIIEIFVNKRIYLFHCNRAMISKNMKCLL